MSGDVLELQEDNNVYTMPEEIVNVRQIFRRSIGSRSGGGDGGTLFEPFNLAYTNTYLLASSNMGGVATYNMFSQFQELVGRMFGSFIEFKWNTTTKKLTILQRPRQGEEVLMYVYMYRPDTELFKDYLAKKWIKDYTLAKCKFMLGEARSKFNTIAGPQGGTTLNGDALKQEVIKKTLPALAAVVPDAVPVPVLDVLSCAVATKIIGTVPGSAGV